MSEAKKLCPMRAPEFCDRERCAWWHRTHFEDDSEAESCAVVGIARGSLVMAGALDSIANVAEAMAAIVPRGGNHAA